MNTRLGFLLVLPLLGMGSCFPDPGGFPTVVTGKVTDKFTELPLTEVPLEIWECDNRVGFSGPFCDRLKVAATNKDGVFQMRFVTKSGFHYKFGIPWGDTFEGISIAYHGAILKEGALNQLDLTTFTYKVLKLHVATLKTKKYLSMDLKNGHYTDAWYFNRILQDTIDENQQLDTSIYVRVSPMKYFLIERTSCDMIDQGLLRNCLGIRTPAFFVDYSDTTQIEIR